MSRTRMAAVGFLLTLLVGSGLMAQTRGNPAALAAAQREAMGRLGFMDGAWRGSAWTILPSGEKHTLTQTERVGPFLNGAVKVIEGRGYEPDGSTGFNAFAIVSFDPATGGYRLHSYAQGNVGEFTLVPTAEGYTWEIPAGPATIRYTAVVSNGNGHETGARIVPGLEPQAFFEMNLVRLGDTDWPAGGAVSPE